MARPRGLEDIRQQVSLRQRVVETLRDNIVYGTFQPGQRLVERDLCESMDISRTLLREALQQLQAEGLVTYVLHKGPSVATITEEDAREIYQVRRLLEQAAGHDFALYATDEQVAQLAKAVELFRRAPRSDPHALLEAKNEFYNVLFEGCGNKLISQILVQLNNRITMLRRMSLGQSGRMKTTVEELAGIVSAIQARDADLAARLCAQHVDGAAAVVMATFKADPDRTPARGTRPRPSSARSSARAG